MTFVRKYWIPLASSLLLAILLGLAIYRLIIQAQVATSEVIIEDIATIAPLLKKIHERCTILSFEHDKNYIDFLTVKSFVGSDVGALHLLHPNNWDGPYAKTNPSIQSKVYEIVKMKDGAYIVPGTGVKLSNDKVMGVDIIITPETDPKTVITEQTGLIFEGRPLALRVGTLSDVPGFTPTCCGGLSELSED